MKTQKLNKTNNYECTSSGTGLKKKKEQRKIWTTEGKTHSKIQTQQTLNATLLMKVARGEMVDLPLLCLHLGA